MYLNSFDSFVDMVSNFEGKYNLKEEDVPRKYDGVSVLLASYGTGSYEGSAFVLFKKGDKLYEVNGSHCSCHGLEDQWYPEETTVRALRYRLENGELGEDKYSGNIFKDQLASVLDKVEREEGTT